MDGMRNSMNAGPMSKVTAPGVLVCAMFAVSFLGVESGVGQCLQHRELRTAAVFANETSYDLTFFIDHAETGIEVPSKTVSPEQPVEPGEHMFRARAMINGRAVWVWVINEVPRAYVCTWTITDPEDSIRINSNKDKEQQEQRNVKEQ